VGLLLRTVNAFRIATLLTIQHQQLEFTDSARAHARTHTNTVLALTLTLPVHNTVTENCSILRK